MGMKKKLILFSFVLFFSTLCASFLAQKGQGKPFHDDTLKKYFLQESDNGGQTEIYIVSEIQDLSDCNDLFFAESLLHKPVAAVQNRIYITEPRYILYHSLQIAGC